MSTELQPLVKPNDSFDLIDEASNATLFVLVVKCHLLSTVKPAPAEQNEKLPFSDTEDAKEEGNSSSNFAEEEEEDDLGVCGREESIISTKSARSMVGSSSLSNTVAEWHPCDLMAAALHLLSSQINNRDWMVLGSEEGTEKETKDQLAPRVQLEKVLQASTRESRILLSVSNAFALNPKGSPSSFELEEFLRGRIQTILLRIKSVYVSFREANNINCCLTGELRSVFQNADVEGSPQEERTGSVTVDPWTAHVDRQEGLGEDEEVQMLNPTVPPPASFSSNEVEATLSALDSVEGSRPLFASSISQHGLAGIIYVRVVDRQTGENTAGEDCASSGEESSSCETFVSLVRSLCEREGGFIATNDWKLENGEQVLRGMHCVFRPLGPSLHQSSPGFYVAGLQRALRTAAALTLATQDRRSRKKRLLISVCSGGSPSRWLPLYHPKDFPLETSVQQVRERSLPSISHKHLYYFVGGASLLRAHKLIDGQLGRGSISSRVDSIDRLTTGAVLCLCDDATAWLVAHHSESSLSSVRKFSMEPSASPGEEDGGGPVLSEDPSSTSRFKFESNNSFFSGGDRHSSSNTLGLECGRNSANEGTIHFLSPCSPEFSDTTLKPEGYAIQSHDPVSSAFRSIYEMAIIASGGSSLVSSAGSGLAGKTHAACSASIIRGNSTSAGSSGATASTSTTHPHAHGWMGLAEKVLIPIEKALFPVLQTTDKKICESSVSSKVTVVVLRGLLASGRTLLLTRLSRRFGIFPLVVLHGDQLNQSKGAVKSALKATVQDLFVFRQSSLREKVAIGRLLIFVDKVRSPQNLKNLFETIEELGVEEKESWNGVSCGVVATASQQRQSARCWSTTLEAERGQVRSVSLIDIPSVLEQADAEDFVLDLVGKRRITSSCNTTSWPPVPPAFTSSRATEFATPPSSSTSGGAALSRAGTMGSSSATTGLRYEPMSPTTLTAPMRGRFMTPGGGGPQFPSMAGNPSFSSASSNPGGGDQPRFPDSNHSSGHPPARPVDPSTSGTGNPDCVVAFTTIFAAAAQHSAPVLKELLVEMKVDTLDRLCLLPTDFHRYLFACNACTYQLPEARHRIVNWMVALTEKQRVVLVALSFFVLASDPTGRTTRNVSISKLQLNSLAVALEKIYGSGFNFWEALGILKEAREQQDPLPFIRELILFHGDVLGESSTSDLQFCTLHPALRPAIVLTLGSRGELLQFLSDLFLQWSALRDLCTASLETGLYCSIPYLYVAAQKKADSALHLKEVEREEDTLATASIKKAIEIMGSYNGVVGGGNNELDIEPLGLDCVSMRIRLFYVLQLWGLTTTGCQSLLRTAGAALLKNSTDSLVSDVPLTPLTPALSFSSTGVLGSSSKSVLTYPEWSSTVISPSNLRSACFTGSSFQQSTGKLFLPDSLILFLSNQQPDGIPGTGVVSSSLWDFEASFAVVTSQEKRRTMNYSASSSSALRTTAHLPRFESGSLRPSKEDSPEKPSTPGTTVTPEGQHQMRSAIDRSPPPAHQVIATGALSMVSTYLGIADIDCALHRFYKAVQAANRLILADYLSLQQEQRIRRCASRDEVLPAPSPWLAASPVASRAPVFPLSASAEHGPILPNPAKQEPAEQRATPRDDEFSSKSLRATLGLEIVDGAWSTLEYVLSSLMKLNYSCPHDPIFLREISDCSRALKNWMDATVTVFQQQSANMGLQEGVTRHFDPLVNDHREGEEMEQPTSAVSSFRTLRHSVNSVIQSTLQIAEDTFVRPSSLSEWKRTSGVSDLKSKLHVEVLYSHHDYLVNVLHQLLEIAIRESSSSSATLGNENTSPFTPLHLVRQAIKYCFYQFGLEESLMMASGYETQRRYTHMASHRTILKRLIDVEAELDRSLLTHRSWTAAAVGSVPRSGDFNSTATSSSVEALIMVLIHTVQLHFQGQDSHLGLHLKEKFGDVGSCCGNLASVRLVSAYCRDNDSAGVVPASERSLPGGGGGGGTLLSTCGEAESLCCIKIEKVLASPPPSTTTTAATATATSTTSPSVLPVSSKGWRPRPRPKPTAPPDDEQ